MTRSRMLLAVLSLIGLTAIVALGRGSLRPAATAPASAATVAPTPSPLQTQLTPPPVPKAPPGWTFHVGTNTGPVLPAVPPETAGVRRAREQSAVESPQTDCTPVSPTPSPYVYDGCYWDYQTAAYSNDSTKTQSYVIGGYLGDSLNQYNDPVNCGTTDYAYIAAYLNGTVTNENFVQVGLEFYPPGCPFPQTNVFAFAGSDWNNSWHCDPGTGTMFQGQGCSGNATLAPFNMQGNNYYWFEIYASGSQLWFYANSQPIMHFSFTGGNITEANLSGEVGSNTGYGSPDSIMYNSSFAMDADFASVYYVGANQQWDQYPSGWQDNWYIGGPKSVSYYGAAYCLPTPSGYNWGREYGPNYARAYTSYNNQVSSYIVFKDVGACFQTGQTIK